MRFSDAVVSTSDYESAGSSLIPNEGSRRTAHLAVHPPNVGWLIIFFFFYTKSAPAKRKQKR